MTAAAFRVSITESGRQLVDQVAASFTGRIETFTAGLPDAGRQLAARIVAADAHRHGIGLRTAAG